MAYPEGMILGMLILVEFYVLLCLLGALTSQLSSCPNLLN